MAAATRTANVARSRRAFTVIVLIIACTGAATLLTWYVRRAADDTMYVFFIAAVALATRLRGWKAGAATLAVSLVTVDALFTAPFGHLRLTSPAALTQLVSFTLVAAAMAWLTEALRRARQDAYRLAAEANEARRAAESTSAARLDFLTALSHEVRTPINAVLGYADLLDAGTVGEVTESQAAYVTRLRGAARHLLTVVNEVLDVAKADTGNLELDIQAAPAGDAIDSAVSLILPQALSKDIRLTVKHDDGLRFLGDVDRTREILVNVLANAVKFSPRGSRVTVSAGNGDRPAPTGLEESDDMVWICVSDAGPGIRPRTRIGSSNHSSRSNATPARRSDMAPGLASRSADGSHASCAAISR